MKWGSEVVTHEEVICQLTELLNILKGVDKQKLFIKDCEALEYALNKLNERGTKDV